MKPAGCPEAESPDVPLEQRCLTRAWLWRAVAGAAVLFSGQAQAGALDECYRRAQTRLEVTPCLNAQKQAATDAMLEELLAASQSLQQIEQASGRSGGAAALKQSQRDFERYLASHCQVVLHLYDSGTGAGQAQLACEVDLLRQRGAALRQWASAQNESRK